MLVQANTRSRLAGHVCLSATFDEALVAELAEGELPDGWDARPYTSVSQRLGDAWLEAKTAAVLRVPSVVVPIESNYLIDPAHPDFPSIRIGTPSVAPFDPRLLSEPRG